MFGFTGGFWSGMSQHQRLGVQRASPNIRRFIRRSSYFLFPQFKLLPSPTDLTSLVPAAAWMLISFSFSLFCLCKLIVLFLVPQRYNDHLDFDLGATGTWRNDGDTFHSIVRFSDWSSGGVEPSSPAVSLPCSTPAQRRWADAVWQPVRKHVCRCCSLCHMLQHSDVWFKAACLVSTR